MEDFRFLDEEGRAVVFCLLKMIIGFAYSVNDTYQQLVARLVLF